MNERRKPRQIEAPPLGLPALTPQGCTNLCLPNKTLSCNPTITLFHHFMANRWGNNGNSDRLYFWGAPKSLQMVTAATKLRHLLLGRKAMINLNSILKSRDIIFPTNVHLVKAIIFPVVMYGCKSWTIKKAEY